ncbi:MAG TPA: tetratricopeptide repeat protein [Qipengyuania sp.]|nr:tetratricopeptide repeat protein [Qipengyuania sp.]
MSLPGNPIDAIPAQAWLLFVLAMIAWSPASYVWRYLAHDRAPRDITLPPEDLSWKSKPQLYRSLAVLAGLAGATFFILSPQAERFAKSDWFAPTLLGAIGSYAIGTVISGWRNREIEPLSRGLSKVVQRDEQPKLYWASLGWNTVVGVALLGASVGVSRDILTPNCDDPDTEDEMVLNEALAACNTLIADTGLDREARAELLAARGRVHHRLGETSAAISDYSSAIALDPLDSYSLNNRGDLHLWTGNPGAAIEDFDAALALRPDNDEAYLNRGWAHVQLGHYELARRDFGRLGSQAPPWPQVLAQGAEFAIERKDYNSAIQLSSEALKLDPRNRFALRLRAEAYWETGQRALSEADDDRVRAIEGYASE